LSDAGLRFPILGGRLLKEELESKSDFVEVVSNPWREAIEAETIFSK